MNIIFNILASLTSLYLLLIIIRILLTWFSGAAYSKPVAVLSVITDPYLNWFRRFPGLQIGGFLDVSPVVAMAALSILNNIFMTMAHYGYITVGFVLALIVRSLWSAVSFMLGFIIVILGLRLFAYLTQQNTFSPFWRVIDAISQPILFRINRLFFGNRGARYMSTILTALALFLITWIGGGIAIKIAAFFLMRLPI